MLRTSILKYFGLRLGTLVAVTLLASSCTAARTYSRSAAETACASFDRCAVYDGTGSHQVACYAPAQEAPLVFAGDSGWPLGSATCQSRALRAPSAG